MESKLMVGVITSTHGIKGEVKVYPTTDDPARFKQLKEVTAVGSTLHQQFHIESVKLVKGFPVLKLKGIHSIEQAQVLRNAELYIERSQAVPLQENEYYRADLIGMTVVTDTGATIGKIVQVMETGANDVYVVQKADGNEQLIPAILDCVRKVDLSANVMMIHPMKGLLS